MTNRRKGMNELTAIMPIIMSTMFIKPVLLSFGLISSGTRHLRDKFEVVSHPLWQYKGEEPFWTFLNDMPNSFAPNWDAPCKVQ